MSTLRELVGNGRPLPTNIPLQERMRLISGNRMQNFPVDNAIGDDINVGELVGAHHRRKEQRQQIYEMVYRKCCHRIRYANDVQYVKECFFRVPEVQLWNGIPRYEINSVLSYIMIKLKQKGFDVKYQRPDGVLVNWSRMVANKSLASISSEKEIRFQVDEIGTAVKPLDQIATAAQRLAHLPCKNDCCTKPDPRRGDQLSREARLEIERKRQQEEIDRLISRRDGK